MVPRIRAGTIGQDKRTATLVTDPVRDGDGNTFVAELDLDTFKITLARNGHELTRECVWSAAGHTIRFPKELDPVDGASPLPMQVAVRLRDFIKRRVPVGYLPPHYAGD